MKRLLCTALICLVFAGYLQAAETPPSFSLNSSFVAFSPDSKGILTTSQQYIAKIWDADTGEELQKFDAEVDRQGTTGAWGVYMHPCPKTISAAFSPDGKRLITAGADKVARIWCIESGTKLHTLKGHTDSVAAAAFSPDGKKVATASWDGTARIWDAETGNMLQTLRHYWGWVASVTFSPDGEGIVTHIHNASRPTGIPIWDVNTGRVVRVLTGHSSMVRVLTRTGFVASAVFSPDRKKIISVHGGDWYDNVRIWDTESGKELHKLEPHTVGFGRVASISTDGKRIAKIRCRSR